MPGADGPLTQLANLLLRRAPPSLAGLLHLIVPDEGYLEFLNIVRNLVPDYQGEILGAGSPGLQIVLFAARFREQYFPIPMLEDGYYDDFGYYDLAHGLPLWSLGMGWDDWHELPDSRLGHRLLMCLVESPWFQDGGARIALMESCLEHVPAEIMRRVPADGYNPVLLHEWLDDGQYSAVAVNADMAWHETGSIFLDMDEEEWNFATWDLETVVDLTQQWQRADNLTDQVVELEEWLEADPPVRFGQLLDYIDSRRPRRSRARVNPPEEESNRLIDIFRPEE